MLKFLKKKICKIYNEHYLVYEQDEMIAEIYRDEGTPWIVKIAKPLQVDDLQSIIDWCHNDDVIPNCFCGEPAICEYCKHCPTHCNCVEEYG